MVPACPKPSEAPNPAMVWNVAAPLMVAVSAAAAGPAGPRAVKTLTPSNVTEAISDTPIVRLVGVNTVLLNTGLSFHGLAECWTPGDIACGSCHAPFCRAHCDSRQAGELAGDGAHERAGGPPACSEGGRCLRNCRAEQGYRASICLSSGYRGCAAPPISVATVAVVARAPHVRMLRMVIS